MSIVTIQHQRRDFRAFAAALSCLLAAYSTAVCAEETCVTLGEVRTAVVDNHPMLRSADADIESAEGKQLSADGFYDTKLKVQGKDRAAGFFNGQYLDAFVEKPFQDFGGRTFGGYRFSEGTYPEYEGDFETGEDGEAFAGIAVSLLRNREIDEPRGKIAQSQLDVEVQGLERERVEIGLNRAYQYSYFMWRDALARQEIKQELLQQALDREGQLEILVDAGDKPMLDLLDNRRAVLKRKTNLKKADAEVIKFAAKLSLFYRDQFGQPQMAVGAKCETRAFLGAAQAAKSAEAELESLVEMGLAARPELKILSARSQQASVDQRLGENALIPALDVELQAGNDFGSGKESKSDTEVKVGLKLEVPLQTRKGEGLVAAARAKQRSLAVKRLFNEEKIKVEVETALAQYRLSRQRLRLATEEARVAEEVASAERVKFFSGDSDIVTVNLREQFAADAKINQIEAARDVLLARADLKAAIGVGL